MTQYHVQLGELFLAWDRTTSIEEMYYAEFNSPHTLSFNEAGVAWAFCLVPDSIIRVSIDGDLV